jgi:hypothetical protein
MGSVATEQQRDEMGEGQIGSPARFLDRVSCSEADRHGGVVW